MHINTFADGFGNWHVTMRDVYLANDVNAPELERLARACMRTELQCRQTIRDTYPETMVKTVLDADTIEFTEPSG